MLADFAPLFVFLVNFFSRKKKLRPLVLSGLLGLLLDFISPLPFGLFFVFLIFLSSAILKVSALVERSSIFSFLIIFFFTFWFYQLPFLFVGFVWASALYKFSINLIIALIIFLIYDRRKN